ncbi:MAG: methylmalonyl Co-A mutase-associated GTPase MeaB [Acidobacteria bacterium]|nr:methylmalonyl Co-A mutase-associated GTPase MeaB [Acidobacteriota bacterium]MCW5969969.1 methylmalonyl Co-A mutase-associated GTPase MeaB [Blastocatellales bacterium]
MTKQSALVDRIVSRDLRAVARAITQIENDAPAAGEILKGIFPHTGRSLTIGITGAPGAGKSSLVDRLAAHYLAEGRFVGIIAVDPSSPFSGGALLGDRIRMQGLATNPNVFIRSMATRGNLGGLARATIDAVAVLDAAGYDRVLVETVGVGQDEVDIVKAADVSVVVLVPGMGDDIQAIKAGIMEIGDVFVINKAERDGVERTEREVLALLEMTMRPDLWQPPIVRTVATEGRGIDEFAQAVERYGEYRREQPLAASRRAATAETRLLEMLRDAVMKKIIRKAVPHGALQEMAIAVSTRTRDPYSIVEEITKKVHIDPADAAPSGNSSGPAIEKIQHLGVAVSSIDDALGFWRDALGLEVLEVETVEDQGVRVAMLPIGESRIELLEATGVETPVGKFLSKRGAGIHHICIEVIDITATLARLKERSIRLIDEEPRRGAGGMLVAFVHPASTGGVLLELTQKGSGKH